MNIKSLKNSIEECLYDSAWEHNKKILKTHSIRLERKTVSSNYYRCIKCELKLRKDPYNNSMMMYVDINNFYGWWAIDKKKSMLIDPCDVLAMDNAVG